MIWILVFLMMLVIYNFYLLGRNDKILDYRLDIIRRIYLQDDWENLLLKFEKISYVRMLFSFKPLKDKYWFDEEFINKLNSK